MSRAVHDLPLILPSDTQVDVRDMAANFHKSIKNLFLFKV
jgi:hypothetical protein